MAGLEIRVKVSDYVKDKVAALRAQHPGQYTNIACIRGNAMKAPQLVTDIWLVSYP